MNKQNNLHMNSIKDVAEKLNEFSKNFEIGRLQEIRRKIKNRNRFAIKLPKIFSKRSIKIKKDYAFHAGGYNELQYNICYENDSKLFRYGIAFSLQKSASFHNPVGELTPKINRFNEFLKFNPERYHNLFLWYFQRIKNKEKRSDILHISTISENLINVGTFIFIGKYFRKTIQELDSGDIIKVLETFDDLLELYKYVEKQSVVEEKIARICWNTAGWKYPSGIEGKSTSATSYEAMNNYGHEEWLFDKIRILNDYHYAFLEPLRLVSDKHVGKIYNISLFTIDCNGNKYFVGKINNIECISKERSKEIYEIYREKGWLSEMMNEIKIAGGNFKAFNNISPEIFFNFRFKLKDLLVSGELEKISEEDINVVTSRFTLLSKRNEFIIETELDNEDEGRLRNTKMSKVVYKRESEIDPYHSKMQNAIWELLKSKYKKEYSGVFIEKNRIDIKGETHEGKWHYFEIKTDSSKKSIRKALGQIMEYCYWPESERAVKLIVVSDTAPDLETRKYLNYIRAKFKIPIFYRFFDFDAMLLSNDF